MADKIPAYAGRADLKKMGRMAPPPNRDDRMAKIGDWRDAKGYAGEVNYQAAKSGDLGQYEKSEAVNRPGVYADESFITYDQPYFSHMWVGRPDQLLGNPHINQSMDEHTAGLSTMSHIKDVISQPGAVRTDLFKALLRADRALAKEALEIGDKATETAMFAQHNSTARVFHAARLAARAQFGIPSKEELFGPKFKTTKRVWDKKSKRYVEQEMTAQEVIKANASKAAAGPKKNFPQSDADIDWKKFGKDFVEFAKQPTARAHKRTIGKTEQNFKGMYGVLAAPNQKQKALEMIEKVPAGCIVAPAKAIHSAVGRNTKARVEKTFRDNAQNKNANREMIDKVDTVIVLLDDSPKGRTWQDAGYAATQGKLGKAFDSSGKELDLQSARKMLLDAYVSDAERRRASVIESFDADMSSPEGRFALSLIKSEKEGSFLDEDIDKLAKSGMNIKDVVELAETEAGRDFLSADPKTSAEGLGMTDKGIRLLRDDTAITDASNGLTDIRDQMARSGTTLIGPDDMPDNWANKPSFAFFKGDVSELKQSTATVGIIGDEVSDREESESARNIIGSRSAPLVAGLSNQDVTRVMVEGQLPFKEEAQSGDIVWLPSGHSIVTDTDHRREREAMNERGVMTLSLLPPEGNTHYNSRTRTRELVPAVANDITRAKAAKVMGGNVQDLVVTNIDPDARRSAAREAVAAYAKEDRRPICVEYGDLKKLPHAGGNIALTTKRGEAAFVAAGMGEAQAAKLSEMFKGAKPAISTGMKFDQAAATIADKANGRDFKKVVIEQKAKVRSEVIY